MWYFLTFYVDYRNFTSLIYNLWSDNFLYIFITFICVKSMFSYQIHVPTLSTRWKPSIWYGFSACEVMSSFTIYINFLKKQTHVFFLIFHHKTLYGGASTVRLIEKSVKCTAECYIYATCRPDGGLNPGSSVYETDALPLGHRAWWMRYVEIWQNFRPHNFSLRDLEFFVWRTKNTFGNKYPSICLQRCFRFVINFWREMGLKGTSTLWG